MPLTYQEFSMKTVQLKFTEYIPEQLEQGFLYISIEYCTAVHLCVCGCGHEVVTPISPSDWQLTFDGKTISFSPSIGNWNFPCRSHYWIIKNEIRYADAWNDKQITTGRKKDKKNKKKYNSKKKRSVRTTIIAFSKKFLHILS